MTDRNRNLFLPVRLLVVNTLTRSNLCPPTPDNATPGSLGSPWTLCLWGFVEWFEDLFGRGRCDGCCGLEGDVAEVDRAAVRCSAWLGGWIFLIMLLYFLSQVCNHQLHHGWFVSNRLKNLLLNDWVSQIP